MMPARLVGYEDRQATTPIGRQSAIQTTGPKRPHSENPTYLELPSHVDPFVARASVLR